MHITLNLLPPSKKKSLHTGLVIAYVQTMTLLLFLAVLFVSGTLFSVDLMLKDQQAQIEKQASASGSDESTGILNNIKEVNSYLDSAESLQKGFVSWSDVIMKIAAAVPPGAQINHLTINQDGHISLAGSALTRADALELDSKLKAAPFLTEVVSPLSNILQKTNVSFQFDMKYAPPASK